jgi:hypothetical protein
MEAIHSSAKSVLTRATWHHIPEDCVLHSYCRENLPSCKFQEAATFVHASHSQTVDEVKAAAATAWISRGTCHRILSDDLNMSRVAQRSVSHWLMQDHRDSHMNTSGELINAADKDGTFLKWIVTGDETWCFI